VFFHHYYYDHYRRHGRNIDSSAFIQQSRVFLKSDAIFAGRNRITYDQRFDFGTTIRISFEYNNRKNFCFEETVSIGLFQENTMFYFPEYRALEKTELERRCLRSMKSH